MDNPNVPDNKKDAWMPELKGIIQKLNVLISQIEATGLIMSDKQILYGFEVE